MGDMMWWALYAAFGLVALWLIWELLMQYKAPFVWRALALLGFLTLVAGVPTGQLLLIFVGVLVFIVGQAKVTLSYRQGYSEGWVVSRRPRDEYDDEYEEAAGPRYGEAGPPYEAAYAGSPYGAGSGSEPGYREAAAAGIGASAPGRGAGSPYAELADYAGAGAGVPAQAMDQTAQFSFAAEQPQPASYAAAQNGYDTYGGGSTYDSGSYATTSPYDSGSYATTSAYDSGSWSTVDTGSHGYGRDQQIYANGGGYAGDHQYAGYDSTYTDAYSGTEYAAPSYYDSTQGGGQSYDTYGGEYGQQQAQYGGGVYDSGGYPVQAAAGYAQDGYAQNGYGQNGYGGDGYAQDGYAVPAPAPDGVWMPQQRDGDPLGGNGQDPYGQGYRGYEQQYRY